MDILMVAFISGFATAAILSDGPSQLASAFWRAIEGTWDNIKDVVTLGPMRRRRARLDAMHKMERIEATRSTRYPVVEYPPAPTRRVVEVVRTDDKDRRKYFAPGYSLGVSKITERGRDWLVLRYEGTDVYHPSYMLEDLDVYRADLIKHSWQRHDHGIDGQKPTHQPLAEVGQAPVEDGGMCTDGIVETEPLPESGPGLYGMPPEGTFVNTEEVDDPDASVTHIELTQYADVERVHLDNGTNFLRTKSDPPPYPFTHDRPVSD